MENQLHTAPLSPERQSKNDIAVTPDGPILQQLHRKRQWTDYLKRFVDVKPRNLMMNPCEAFVISMKGNLDLIYFDQGSSEAFVKPLIDILFYAGEDDATMSERDELRQKTKIIAVVARRVSFDVDEPQYKTVKSDNTVNASYKKQYFVRYDARFSTVSEKKQNLEAALRVRSVLRSKTLSVFVL
jgi:hypothetical protein